MSTSVASSPPRPSISPASIFATISGVVTIAIMVVFFLPWANSQLPAFRRDLTVSQSGFGHVAGDTEDGSGTRMGYLALAVLILAVIIAGTVLVAATRLHRLGAVVTLTGGGFLAIYGFFGLVTKFNADDGSAGEQLGDLPWLHGHSYTSSIGYGSVLGILLGLVVIGLGSVYLAKTRGPIVPSLTTSGQQ